MHIQTHILSGWCLGNIFHISRRERLFSMIAATVPDLDGLSLFGGPDCYFQYHHIITHNIIAGLLVSILLTIYSYHKLKAFLLYLFLFHFHLFLDYSGSGPGWGLRYLWPFFNSTIENYNAWSFSSWQNIGTFLFFLVWTLVIIIIKGRTPLEAVMPSLDKQIVAVFQQIVKRQYPVK